MASIRTLSFRSALLVLRAHIAYSLSKFKAEPRTQQYVPIFEALRDGWHDVYAQEIALHDAVTEAQALVDTRDAALNRVASRVSKTVLTITGDDTSHILYTHYFGKKTLHTFCRPVLNRKLAAMGEWAISLKDGPHDALKALAPEVESAVALAEEAAANKVKIEQQNRFFRVGGARRKFFDKVNATRKLTHGDLAKIAHEHDLSSAFASSFFKREAPREEEEEPTVETVEVRLQELRQETAEQEKLLGKLKTERDDAAKAEAAREAMKQELLVIEKARAEMDQKAAALRAMLDGKK